MVSPSGSLSLVKTPGAAAGGGGVVLRWDRERAGHAVIGEGRGGEGIAAGSDGAGGRDGADRAGDVVRVTAAVGADGEDGRGRGIRPEDGDVVCREEVGLHGAA